MRVLMTTDTVGGVWQYSLALVRELVEQHGCDVLLVCLQSFGQDIREMIPNGVELVSLPFAGGCPMP